MVRLEYFLSELPKIDLSLLNGEKSGNKALGQKYPPLMIKQRWWFLSFSSFDLSFFSHYFLYGFCFVPSVTSSVLHVQFFFSVIILFPFTFFFYVHFFLICYLSIFSSFFPSFVLGSCAIFFFFFFFFFLFFIIFISIF